MTTFTYVPPSRLTSVTDPNGNTTQYQYDQNGDILATEYADGTIESLAYNPIGEITQSNDGDKNVINYTYNSSGQVLTKTYADGSQVTYTYYSEGNLTSVTDATGTTTLSYNEREPIDEDQLPRRDLAGIHL